MRRSLIAVACAAGIGALASAQPVEKPCCDLWIFEAAGAPDSYAIASRRDGRALAVIASPTGAAHVLEGAAARATVRRWTAMSRLEASSSVLLDARESRISLDVDVADPPDAEDNGRANMLVLVRYATPAQARTFIKEMPRLAAADRARLTAAVPD